MVVSVSLQNGVGLKFIVSNMTTPVSTLEKPSDVIRLTYSSAVRLLSASDKVEDFLRRYASEYVFGETHRRPIKMADKNEMKKLFATSTNFVSVGALHDPWKEIDRRSSMWQRAVVTSKKPEVVFWHSAFRRSCRLHRASLSTSTSTRTTPTCYDVICMPSSTTWRTCGSDSHVFRSTFRR